MCLIVLIGTVWRNFLHVAVAAWQFTALATVCVPPIHNKSMTFSSPHKHNQEVHVTVSTLSFIMTLNHLISTGTELETTSSRKAATYCIAVL